MIRLMKEKFTSVYVQTFLYLKHNTGEKRLIMEINSLSLILININIITVLAIVSFTDIRQRRIPNAYVAELMAIFLFYSCISIRSTIISKVFLYAAAKFFPKNY